MSYQEIILHVRTTVALPSAYIWPFQTMSFKAFFPAFNVLLASMPRHDENTSSDQFFSVCLKYMCESLPVLEVLDVKVL